MSCELRVASYLSHNSILDTRYSQLDTHMHIEEFRTYCLSKSGVTESFPFDEATLVFKVMSKMFALTGLELSLIHI